MKLELPLEKINELLQALSTQPYQNVFQLISEITKQVQPQVDTPKEIEEVDP